MNIKKSDGFAQSSGMGLNPAILVVDYMKGFTDPDSPLGSNLDNEIQATKELLDIARKENVPIIFTTVSYEPGFKEGAHFIRKIPALKILSAGSEACEIDTRLDRDEENETLIVKKFASAFFGTAISSVLSHQRIDTVIIVGCSTSGCIRATAVDALQHGYLVVIPEECVGDRSQSAHDASLSDIQTKYGDVVSLETVKNYLTHLKGDMSYV